MPLPECPLSISVLKSRNPESLCINPHILLCLQRADLCKRFPRQAHSWQRSLCLPISASEWPTSFCSLPPLWVPAQRIPSIPMPALHSQARTVVPLASPTLDDSDPFDALQSCCCIDRQVRQCLGRTFCRTCHHEFRLASSVLHVKCSPRSPLEKLIDRKATVPRGIAPPVASVMRQL